MRVLRSPADAISSALLPASCSLCGSPLPRLSSAPICDACWSEITSHSGLVCSRCGDTLDAPVLDGIPATNLCRACAIAPPPFAKAVSFGIYDGRLRDAIHALKYDRIRPAARNLGALLAEAIAQILPEAPSAMLVVPVPLHRTKNRQRGFNQARTLAQAAIGSLSQSHPHWKFTLAPSTLMRLRATETQAGLTPTQRRRNVRGAFKVSDPNAVSGQHVLLVDDILTTGATARAAAQSLIKAGAASVYVATLARARRINSNVSRTHAFADMHSSSSSHQPAS
ncbi:ComF family protein [Occallatibacter savannae]|uniref:ComF family protein n=1 Tax=Occallatibacter savannae TaxID=1002691 RepID=UPI000D69BD3A|nr:ComF family protein [Occallatibacter savannae]